MGEPDIPAFLDRRPIIWSYSFLHNFRDVCNHQAFRRYIKRDLPFVETKEMKWGNDVHTAFEHRVGGGKPLPVEMQQWEKYAVPFDGKSAVTEQKLGITALGHPCDFWAKDCWGRGKIDLTLINGTTAYIGDWKSGSSKYEDPFELEIGAVLLHAANPGLTRIVGQYFWLKDDKISPMYELTNTRKTWQEICSIMAAIEKRNRVEAAFEKNRSGLCGFCNVPDCEFNTSASRK